MMKPTLHLFLFLLVTPACSICHRRRRPWQGLVAYRDDDPESQSATSVEMSDVVDKRVPKAEEQDKDTKPLQSEPVALPKLTEEPKLPWGKSRSFDTVPLPATRQARARTSSKTETPKRRKGPTSGTRFDLRFPSKEKITQWFAPSQEKTSSRQLFNHDSVGMTNPVLSVNLNNNNHHQDTDLQSVALASSDNKLELEESWIPAMTSTNPKQPQQQGARVLQYKLKSPESTQQDAQHAWFPPTCPSNRRKWRLCRFRRRVGQGQACYERVKEAALEWEFQNAPKNKGILPVEQRTNDDDSGFSLGQSPTVQPLWSGPHTEASRRMVTYTRTGFKSKWLPKLYTLNPVMVVYDLLDQRGPATTYTSTAYATLKGHLLSGEERVTVAYRDGTGFVDVEIVSYSRPAASLKGKLVWPLIGGMQQAFFQQQMDYLEQVASSSEDADVAPR